MTTRRTSKTAAATVLAGSATTAATAGSATTEPTTTAGSPTAVSAVSATAGSATTAAATASKATTPATSPGCFGSATAGAYLQTSEPIHDAPLVIDPCYPSYQTERVGILEVLELLEMVAPKNEMCKFLGEANKMNFERSMERMKQAMDAEGVTDNLRVGCIDNWFSGVALKIVQSKINHGIDTATTLSGKPPRCSILTFATILRFEFGFL
jgi:hypothetical protein